MGLNGQPNLRTVLSATPCDADFRLGFKFEFTTKKAAAAARKRSSQVAVCASRQAVGEPSKWSPGHRVSEQVVTGAGSKWASGHRGSKWASK